MLASGSCCRHLCPGSSVWFFLVSTLCSSTATVCQSRSSKLRTCGKKQSVCSIVGSLVRFQPAVGLGPRTRARWISQLSPNPKSKGFFLVTETQCRSQCRIRSPTGIQSCSSRFLRKTGRSSHLALLSPKTLLFASVSRSWCPTIGSWSQQWSRLGGMTGTCHHRSARLGSKQGWHLLLFVDML